MFHVSMAQNVHHLNWTATANIVEVTPRGSTIYWGPQLMKQKLLVQISPFPSDARQNQNEKINDR